MEKSKEDNLVKSKILVLIAIILVLIISALRVLVITNLPVFAYIDYVDDDELMVQQSKSIISGNWLGEYYSYNTLLKGPIFPLYLAFLHLLGVPYILGTTCFYILACMFFTCSLKDIVKKKWILLLIYTILLFNPIMFSVDFQRVYRNGLAPILALFIFGFYNIMLTKTHKTVAYVLSIVLASLVFPFFYYIREDSMWLIPFIIFYSIIIGIKIINDLIKNKYIVKNIIKIALLFLPIATLSLFSLIIGNINYNHYGARIVNVNDFENLNETLYMISIVKDESDITNSREKLRRLYDISPSLNSIKDEFELSLDTLSGKEGGEIKNGMFSWAVLSAISSSGYSSYEKQNEILGNISSEIKDAIKNGKCETQKLVPVFNDVSIKEFSWDKMFGKTLKSLEIINNYSVSGTMDTYGSLYDSPLHLEERVRLFLEMTNDKVLLNDEKPVYECGLGELVKTNQEEYINKMQPKVDILKNLQNIYTIFFKILGILGYCSYIIVTIILIILIRKKNYDFVNDWFVLSGLAGSIFTLCVGIAYTAVTKVNVAIPFYLMSGYVLNMIFVLLSVITLIFMIKELLIKK